MLYDIIFYYAICYYITLYYTTSPAAIKAIGGWIALSGGIPPRLKKSALSECGIADLC